MKKTLSFNSISSFQRWRSKTSFFLQQCDLYAGSPEANAAIMVERLLKVAQSLSSPSRKTDIPMVVFSELTLPLLEAKQLLREDIFIERCYQAESDVQQVAELLDLVMIYGMVEIQEKYDENGHVPQKRVVNCIKAYIPSKLRNQIDIRTFDGKIETPNDYLNVRGGVSVVCMSKTQLPCYREQDELTGTDMPFVMKHAVLEISMPEMKSVYKIGFGCCEQTWTHKETNDEFGDSTDYHDDPTKLVGDILKQKDREKRHVNAVLLNLSSSNFVEGKQRHKRSVFSLTAETLDVPIIYSNRAGINEYGFTFPGNTGMYYDSQKYKVNTRLGESEVVVYGNMLADGDFNNFPTVYDCLNEHLSKTFARYGLLKKSPLDDIRSRLNETVDSFSRHINVALREKKGEVSEGWYNKLSDLFWSKEKVSDPLDQLLTQIKKTVKNLDMLKKNTESYEAVYKRKGIVLRLPQFTQPIRTTNMHYTSAFYALVQSICNLPESNRPKLTDITVLHHTPLSSFQHNFFESVGINVEKNNTNLRDYARQHKLLSLDSRILSDMMGNGSRNALDRGDYSPMGSFTIGDVTTLLEGIEIPDLHIPIPSYLQKRESLLKHVWENPFDMFDLVSVAKNSFLWGGREELIELLRQRQSQVSTPSNETVPMLFESPLHSAFNNMGSTWDVAGWVDFVFSQLPKNIESWIHPILAQPFLSLPNSVKVTKLPSRKPPKMVDEFIPFSDPPINAARMISFMSKFKSKNDTVIFPPFSLSGYPGDYGVSNVYLASIQKAWDDVRIAASILRIHVICGGFVENERRNQDDEHGFKIGGKPCVIARFAYFVGERIELYDHHKHSLGIDKTRGIYETVPHHHNVSVGPPFYRMFEPNMNFIDSLCSKYKYYTYLNGDDTQLLKKPVAFSHDEGDSSFRPNLLVKGQLVGATSWPGLPYFTRRNEIKSMKETLTKFEQNNGKRLIENVTRFLKILLNDMGVIQKRDVSFSGLPSTMATILTNRLEKGWNAQYYTRPLGIVIPVRAHSFVSIKAALLLVNVLNNKETFSLDIPIKVLTPTPMSEDVEKEFTKHGVKVVESKKDPSSFATGEGLSSNHYLVMDTLSESQRMKGFSVRGEETVSPLAVASDMDIAQALNELGQTSGDPIYEISKEDRFLSYAWRAFSKYDMDFYMSVNELKHVFALLWVIDAEAQVSNDQPYPDEMLSTMYKREYPTFASLLVEACGQYLIANDPYRGSSRQFPSLGREAADSLIFRPVNFFNDEFTKLFSTLKDAGKFTSPFTPDEEQDLWTLFSYGVKETRMQRDYMPAEDRATVYPNKYPMVTGQVVNSFLWTLLGFYVSRSSSLQSRVALANTFGALGIGTSFGVQYKDAEGKISSRQASKIVQALGTFPINALTALHVQSDASLAIGAAIGFELVARGGLDRFVSKGSLDPATGQALHRLLLPLSQSFLLLSSVEFTEGVAFPALCLIAMTKAICEPTSFTRPHSRALEFADTMLQTVMLSGIIGFDVAELSCTSSATQQYSSDNTLKAVIVPLYILFLSSLMLFTEFATENRDHARGLLKTGILLSHVVAAAYLDPHEDHDSLVSPLIFTISAAFLFYQLVCEKSHLARDRRGGGLN